MLVGVVVEKIGPPTIPSLPGGPEVLFFSPKVEDNKKVGFFSVKCKSIARNLTE